MTVRDDTAGFGHQPVMVDQIVELFEPVPPGLMVDATVGGGGHAAAVLERHSHLSLIGLDQDDAAIEAATTVLASFGDRVALRQVRFDRMASTVRELGHESVSAVLFDLGVSSAQLDRADRGFSFRNDAPLDMRMDRRGSVTAADVVNSYDERRLASLLRDNGDERFAGRIARAIVAARPLATTVALADVVRDAIPAPAPAAAAVIPARRTFQAIRIEVNDELRVLPTALDDALALLAPGGRCAVLAYHSGEDRIVKEHFRTAATGGCTCPPGLPCSCGATPTVRLLKRGAWKPTAPEAEADPRAESARLRAVEKLEVA